MTARHLGRASALLALAFWLGSAVSARAAVSDFELKGPDGQRTSLSALTLAWTYHITVQGLWCDDSFEHDNGGEGYGLFMDGPNTYNLITNSIFFKVKGHAHNTVGELKQFGSHALIKSVDPGNTVADGNDRADFAHIDLLLKVRYLFLQQFTYLINLNFHQITPL